jgi:hypothetical protein
MICARAHTSRLGKVFANPGCPIHHAKKQSAKPDAAFKAQRDKDRARQRLLKSQAVTGGTSGCRCAYVTTSSRSSDFERICLSNKAQILKYPRLEYTVRPGIL